MPTSEAPSATTTVSAPWHRLTDHVAVITGGNAGIGLGIAGGLIDSGAAVAIWGTNPERNAAAVQQLSARAPGVSAAAFTVDIADEEAVENGMRDVVARFGKIDSCFANAGISGAASATDTLDTAAWKRTLSVNLDGSFYTLRAAARQMREQGEGGSLVVTSSLGSIEGLPGYAPYAASKGAINSVVRALAVELARFRITVNALVPGWIDTSMQQGQLDSDAVKSKILTRIPLRRWGTPEDFEAIAVLLAGNGARYLTGQSIVVDGGYSVF
ncbi:SDR family NAD(P)-dependent oxidoreductase [Rhodococcus sp. NPDC057014]|uniref:SDR family NAD(P)-dependent oxidoreductase n=1 Tax=Rhodococcus sp. NPDC057014 TaxID=3346000 RepID=UPI00363244B0